MASLNINKDPSLFNGANVGKLASHVAGLTKKISFTKTSGNSADVNLERCICQTITASVQVGLNTYYEIGSHNAYRVMGRPQGNGSISNIMGPTKETVQAIAALCDICNPHNLNVQFVNMAPCPEDKTGGGLIFKDCICNSVQVNAEASQDLINGTWQFVCTDVMQIPT